MEAPASGLAAQPLPALSQLGWQLFLWSGTLFSLALVKPVLTVSHYVCQCLENSM